MRADEYDFKVRYNELFLLAEIIFIMNNDW